MGKVSYIVKVPSSEHGFVSHDFKEDRDSAVACARLLNTIKGHILPVTVLMITETVEVEL